MSVVMRIVQQYNACDESKFMELEKKFAALETRRKDFPRGRRLKPIAAVYPGNTLIRECEFPTLAAAHASLSFFAGDHDHEALAKKQRPYFRDVTIEFYEKLEF